MADPKLKPTPPDREESVFSLLKDAGFSNAAIAGIMGTIEVETGGKFDSSQKQGSGGPGRGLFQMEPGTGKLDEYKTWLKNTGRPDSADSQIQFFRDTIYDPSGIKNIVGVDVAGFGNAKKLRKVFETDDPVKIAEAVTNLWEKPGIPHMDRRRKAARLQFQKQKEPASVRPPVKATDPKFKPTPPDRKPRIRIPELEGSEDTASLLFGLRDAISSFFSEDAPSGYLDSTNDSRKLTQDDQEQFSNLMNRLTLQGK